MSIIVLIQTGHMPNGMTVQVCEDVKIECSPRDGFNNKKLLKFENDLRDFINKGLADARERQEVSDEQGN